MKHIKFIPFVITIFLLASGSVLGASTVVSEGVAAITSNIHVKEYRKRALRMRFKILLLKESKL